VKILHILGSTRRLDTFPSVYNALYLLASKGLVNHIATAGALVSFGVYVSGHIKLTQDFFSNISILYRDINNYDYVIAYEPSDMELLGMVSFLCKLKPVIIFHSLELSDYKRQAKKNVCEKFVTKVFLVFVRNNFLGTLLLENKSKYVKRIVRSFFYRLVYGIDLKRVLFARALNAIDYLIIQDHDRLKLFFKYYGNKAIHAFTVPNAYIQELENKHSVVSGFDAIFKSRKPKILYIGSLERWVLSLELFEKIVLLKDYLWVFSGWSGDGFMYDIKRLLKSFDSKHVYIKEDVLCNSDINYLMSCIDIGLCFYQAERDDNITYMGMASGKYHKFLSHNKPVLVSKGLIGLSDFTENNGFGEQAGVSDLHGKVVNVINNYDWYVKNIKERYNMLCSYEKSYNVFLNKIRESM